MIFSRKSSGKCKEDKLHKIKSSFLDADHVHDLDAILFVQYWIFDRLPSIKCSLDMFLASSLASLGLVPGFFISILGLVPGIFISIIGRVPGFFISILGLVPGFFISILGLVMICTIQNYCFFDVDPNILYKEFYVKLFRNTFEEYRIQYLNLLFHIFEEVLMDLGQKND